MLAVTKEAGQYLHNILQQSKAPDSYAIRLVQTDRGLGFAVDEPKPDDRTYVLDGSIVLIINKQVNDDLSGRTLSLREGEAGTKLVLQ